MSYNIEIEDNVPIPEPKPRYRYPWDKLEVGQSFFVGGDNTNRQPPKRLLEEGWEFTSAVATNAYGDKGRRYWRTA